MKNQSIGHQLLNKVPEVTLWFWIIKILCTTVGETAADFLNTNLNLGLTGTSLIMGVLLIIVLIYQFKTKKYTPSIYWLSVVFISIVGTLITDNLTDNFGISLVLTTIVFSVALIATFIAWYKKEGTLSIHSIFTQKRELFYWLTILFTFALGTASGDLLAETLSVGYLLSAIIFAGGIALTYVAYKKFNLNPILAFWIAYILTRPLGASIGDYVSQNQTSGGLGLGTVITSALFLTAILSTVIYLSVTKKDAITSEMNT